MTRECSTCKEIKILECFPFKYKKKNIRHFICKECQKKYNKKYFNGEIKGPHGNIGKKRPNHSLTMIGKGNPMYGCNHTTKTKLKISKTRLERNYSGENNLNYGKKRPETSKRMIECWKDPDFRNKRLKQNLKVLLKHKKMNKKEAELNKLLQKICKGSYKFVGNGKVILDWFNPDFINITGEKKIIELYGDYWHNLPDWKERDKRRKISYNKLGYHFLIVWEHELKNINLLTEKILRFNRSN